MASQGEGRKRRSFLPAPKKASGASPTSPQAPGALPTFSQVAFSASAFLPESKSISLPPEQYSTVKLSTGSSDSFPLLSSEPVREQSQQRSDQSESTGTDTRVEEPAFGIGLRVGARVKIGGVKPGILRYLGTTHLAPGIFCGIELFDPHGNHDGAVNGHRYFVCAPNYGIFAPKEKVCLDTSSSLVRLAPDSDVCYSSTESLSERTQKAFKSFEEGELEAIDCSKLSPILSPQESKCAEDDKYLRKLRSSKLANRSSLSSACSVEIKRSSLESHETGDVTSRKAQPGLYRAPKSSLVTPPLSQSKLPTLSRSYKYSEGYSLSQHSTGIPTYNGEVVLTSSVDWTKSQGSAAAAAGVELDQEHDIFSPRFKVGNIRSSDDSEEDGFLRDTLSTGIKKQLRADSRQYLNFTFDEDELIQSLDQEDAEADYSFQVKDLSSIYSNTTNQLYRDPVFMRDMSADSSFDGFGTLSSKLTEVDKLCPTENFMKLETATIVLSVDAQETASAPPPGERFEAIKSDSYTISTADVTQTVDMNASSSGTEEDGAGLCATRSVSDSQIPPEMLPRIDESKADVLTYDSERYSEDSKNNDDGSNDILNLTQTLDSLKPENGISWHEQDTAELGQSQSYTICTHDLKDKRDSTKRERENSVVVSHSYIISKSDSAASSPCRKYRKISTGSLANEGGDSSSSGTEPKTDSSGENKGDNLDDSSTGASPEVSQALEWDYGQEFDGKIPLAHQDNTMTTSTSTGTSESLSDVLRDVSEQSDGLFEGDAPSSLMEDSDQFEAPDNEFENIDSLEDFPIFGKDSVTVMTDSGISDKDFDFCPTKSSSSTFCGNSSDECSREDDTSSHATARAISSDSSQETLAAEYVADTPGSVEDKDFLSDDMCTTIHTDDTDSASRRDSFGDGNSNSPASVVSIEDVSSAHDKTLVCEDISKDSDRNFSSHEDVSSSSESSVIMTTVSVCAVSPGDRAETVQENLEEDMYNKEGGVSNRRERPVSLLSTTSADTGYVPDSDSELGTLTTNSPNTDWVDRLGITHPTSYAPQDMDAAYDTDTCGPCIKYGQPATESPTASICLSHSITMKTSDDDDYNSDLAMNTEDDRIEADQLYGPGAQDPILTSAKFETGIQGEVSQEADDSSSMRDTSGDTMSVDMESTCSTVQEAGHEGKEDRGIGKDEAVDERKGRSRKPMTITRRRSENIDHKMPNTNVVSRLADYIKSATPLKQKDDKEKEPKKKVSKNTKNSIQKRMGAIEMTNNKSRLNCSRPSSVDRGNNKGDNSVERVKVEKPEKPKAIVKRTPPKSKWGNIMSQIEASKDIAKPKPKSEIKSSLAAYVNAPASQLLSGIGDSNSVIVNMAKTDQAPNQQRKEFVKSKLKQLPPPPPKIDLSKVKSKLNVSTSSSTVKTTPRREQSPSTANKMKTSARAAGKSPARHAEASLHKEAETSKRLSDGSIVLMMRRFAGSVGSTKTSRTDISVCDSTESILGSSTAGISSKRGSVDHNKKDLHRVSSQSLQSERSDKSKSRKEQNNRPHKAQVNSINTVTPPFTPIKIPSRAVEIRIGDGSAVSSQRSSPTPVILKPIKPKPKSTTNSATSANRAWPATKLTALSAACGIKGRNSGGNRSKKPRTTSVTNDSTAGSIAQAEIIRLESLCEARTKELTNTKMQFRAAAQAFDAMAVLVDYCCTDLNAFECPGLARKLDTVEMQLANCITQIADLSCQRDNLDKNLNQVMQEKEEALRKAEEAFNTVHKEREEHARLNHEMDDTHNAALTTQRDELTSKHDETMKKVTQFYDRQIDLLRQAHDRQMTDVKNECKLEMNGVKISHLEEIQELRNKHDSQMEELHKQHRNKLEDITHRFESIKLTLSEKVESLRVECDDLARRARNSEEALQRDADAKVQIALAPYLCLPKEIESLKTVVEMRNEEIQKLRTKNMDLEKQLEEVPIGRDKIISLQQKVENLEAIIDIKTDHEKQLHEKCQVLMRKYDRESRANKRLSMDYEQVVWRMSQSSEFGSSESLTRRNFSWSPPCSEEGSPDSRYRAMSPNTGTSDVVMRVKKRSSHSISEGDRKLRSRSATFVLEKNESRDSHSPSSSPQLKQKRWRKKSQTEEVTAETEQPDLMSHSAGTEILSNVPVQGKEIGGQKDNRDFNGLHMASSGEMVTSYSRSLSGVSDSGMYDSMTRSDVLDSSLVSTDSDWGTSVNLTLKCNSAMDDPESCPLTGGYESSNDITVIHVKQSSSDSDSGNVTVNSLRSDSSSRHPSSSEGQSEDHKQFSSCQVNVTVSLDAALAEDGVFDERVHVDSS